ncbi:hypothetical protein L6164_009151 [Bauhinia variegata]|uniref:Uncharacterized protein n=1 Tax=Bauhinia variegata TaxID=167791 RepID=A0ACB9PJ21_BAUVA|nr:hypothetical protein L6164_009151 [Bauhinia variegata]
MKLFDAHCHLQDPRVLNKAPELIENALEAGVVRFAVNGIYEEDWHLVKEMGETYPSVIPCFGLHPWYVAERSPNWFETLKEYFDATPSAAVGEIGVHKGSQPQGIQADISEQIKVLGQQLELAKELNKPATVHCVAAFDELVELMRSMGPFPAGVILHSYMGSAELVPELSELGSYFSFSGHNMSQNANAFKRVLNAVPSDRILLETDSPDALPKSLLPNETFNQPANLHYVLDYVASLLEVTKEELAELTYHNAVRLFSYKGSKVRPKKYRK